MRLTGRFVWVKLRMGYAIWPLNPSSLCWAKNSEKRKTTPTVPPHMSCVRLDDLRNPASGIELFAVVDRAKSQKSTSLKQVRKTPSRGQSLLKAINFKTGVIPI